MSFWSPENLRRVVGGEWVVPPAAGARVEGVCIDSRAVRPGRVFVAIRGDRTDGHLYLADAARAGAGVLIVEDEGAARSAEAPAVRVADTREALLRLGAAYRKTLTGTRVIAVGGSNGKTTTVRLLEAVLSSARRGTASAKSFNNAVGVPLTILGAGPEDEFLICEVGTNAPGEIAQLAAVVEPDVAVITSIGREHLEGLGSLEGVLREELELLRFVRPGGAAVLNADAPGLVAGAAGMRGVGRIVTFGHAGGADLRIGEVRHEGAGVRFGIAGRGTFVLPLVGRHNASNAAAAVAVAEQLGLSGDQIASGLQLVRGAAWRLERATIGGVDVLNDAYNANPDSMRAALETLADVSGGAARRVVVLGDMLELGEHAEGAHREIGELVARMGVDVAVFVGPNMRHAAAAAPGSVHIDAADEAKLAEVAGLMRPGDCVLLKGSRRMGLERVVRALEERTAVERRTTQAAARS